METSVRNRHLMAWSLASMLGAFALLYVYYLSLLGEGQFFSGVLASLVWISLPLALALQVTSVVLAVANLRGNARGARAILALSIAGAAGVVLVIVFLSLLAMSG